MIRRAITVMAAAALLSLAGSAPALGEEFGLKEFDTTFTGLDGSTVTQAGSHPYAFTTALSVNTVGSGKDEVPIDAVKDLTFELPAGFVADRAAVPYCSNADFADVDQGLKLPACSDSSAIGVVALAIGSDGREFNSAPVYNLTPPPGAVLKFGFIALGVPVTIIVGLKDSPPYNGVATLRNIPQPVRFYGATMTIWGNPVDSSHDSLRGSCVDTLALITTLTVLSKGSCPISLPAKPFLTLPRSCSGPLRTSYEAVSWQDPDAPPLRGFAETHDDATPPTPLGLDGCSKLEFAPAISSQPTTTAAESPTGLDFDLDIDDEGISSPTGYAQANIKKAVVTLPQGVTINPSVAEGLAACSEADLARETVGSQPGDGCPQASKVGTVEVRSPLLAGETLPGSVFVATQDKNPLGSMIALYMVIKDPALGILVKLAGKVEPDPRTGQLITTFDDLPEIPFSHFNFHFREGARSPLITPPLCGTYTTRALFSPSSGGPPLPVSSSFKVTSGVNGGPCPSGSPPFAPGFSAGSNNNDAGSYSPFYMRLTRRDGDQDLTRFSAKLPPGMVARLAGTTQCSDAAIAAAKAKTGLQEKASPSCPASSQIGHVLAGAGVGSQLTYVPGSLYLAGPHDSAPLSVVSVVPAVAGPFDVGTVVTQVALQIDPRTAEVRADGAHSDPIPHILAGIPLKVRDIRVYVDKPSFTLNPTSCDPFSVDATMWGGGNNVFSSSDDAPVSLADRFQAANCASLGFKPKLALALKGGTKRGAHPALTGTYTPRKGDANLKGLVLRLPRSAFLDQAHIRTICTRVQFAANACPEAAIYGHATAYTPILDQPLTGPVYLRSSNHNLPDFVADLHGLVDVEAVARIDSKNGGIRATFENVPDAPLSKVVVKMQGAKKGLIVNSKNLCGSPNRANVQFTGHNGKALSAKPVVKASCGGGGKRGPARQRQRR